MFSLLLYLLFGIGQPSNSQPTPEQPTVQSDDAPTPGPGDNGGENGTVRPPRK